MTKVEKFTLIFTSKELSDKNTSKKKKTLLFRESEKLRSNNRDTSWNCYFSHHLGSSHHDSLSECATDLHF